MITQFYIWYVSSALSIIFPKFYKQVYNFRKENDWSIS